MTNIIKYSNISYVSFKPDKCLAFYIAIYILAEWQFYLLSYSYKWV